MLFYLASLESTEEFVWTLRGGSSCAAFAFDSLYFTMIRYTLLCLFTLVPCGGAIGEG